MRRQLDRTLHQTQIGIVRQKIEICDQGGGVSGLQLGLEPIEIEQKPPQFLFSPGFNQVMSQVPKEVAVVRAGVPAIRALLAVCIQQLPMQADQVILRGVQVVMLQVMQRDAPLGRFALQPQQRLALQRGQQFARLPLIHTIGVQP